MSKRLHEIGDLGLLHASVQVGFDSSLADCCVVPSHQWRESISGVRIANIDCVVAHFIDKQAEPL
jgi:hypothetical protein